MRIGGRGQIDLRPVRAVPLIRLLGGCRRADAAGVEDGVVRSLPRHRAFVGARWQHGGSQLFPRCGRRIPRVHDRCGAGIETEHDGLVANRVVLDDGLIDGGAFGEDLRPVRAVELPRIVQRGFGQSLSVGAVRLMRTAEEDDAIARGVVRGAGDLADRGRVRGVDRSPVGAVEAPGIVEICLS